MSDIEREPADPDHCFNCMGALPCHDGEDGGYCDSFDDCHGCHCGDPRQYEDLGPFCSQCGGDRVPREPADADGLGCGENIHHTEHNLPEGLSEAPNPKAKFPSGMCGLGSMCENCPGIFLCFKKASAERDLIRERHANLLRGWPQE